MSTTETDEARLLTPVQFFGGDRGIAYAKGEGFQKDIPEPTEADLAAIEAAAELEATEPLAAAPVDAVASSQPDAPPEPTDPHRPRPDDPEDKASPGKAVRTPAKN